MSRAAQDHQGEKAIVYFLTCAAVDFYALALPLVMEGAAPAVKESSSAGKKPQKQQGKAGWQVAALHGRMKQSQREATLAAFAAAPSGNPLCLSCVRSWLCGYLHAWLPPVEAKT